VLAVNPPGLGARVAPAMAERKARLPNITALDAQFDDVRLAPASLDAALFHLTYHDAYWESAQFGLNRSDPARLLRELFAAMRPGGGVVVIDHVGRPGVDPCVEAEATHRIDPAVVRADFVRAGFRLEAESQAWRVDGDDPAKSVFDAGLRGRTDRVAYRFRKPR
jgi:predicted methyltransferase